MKKLYKNLPESPGVYIFKDANNRTLYIGKAANLRRRASSYFLRPHDSRIQKLVGLIRKIDHKKTDTALEALILEAELIKKHQPPFNVKEKDDKSFLYVVVTKDKFPIIFLVRGKELGNAEAFGPFTETSNLREALRIIRRIFPYSTHPDDKVGKLNRPCFDYQIGLCPGTCIGTISREDYLKNVRNIKLLFSGKKKRILANLKKEMQSASRQMNFERAAKFRKQIFALGHIQDVALVNDSEEELKTNNQKIKIRIEGYDVSNISGISAVGAMVVFTGGKPDINEYRKFKIGTVFGPNDVGMLKEILERRFRHREWRLPNLVLIDGGKGQVNVAKEVLSEAGLKIPIVGIAKGAKRKKNEFIGKIPQGVDEKTLIKIRDESHQFAITYHKKVRKFRFTN